MPVLPKPVDCNKSVDCTESTGCITMRCRRASDERDRFQDFGHHGPAHGHPTRAPKSAPRAFAAPRSAGFPSSAMPDIGDNLRRFPLACKSAQSERNRSFRALH
jgi:hypothetical protein